MYSSLRGSWMDPVTGAYVGIMMIGGFWIIWRIVIYVRIQKRREYLWHKLVYDEQFMNFLQGIKAKRDDVSTGTVCGETESGLHANPSPTNTENGLKQS